MRGYEGQERHRADDHLSRFEAEMDRLKTDREKAVQHAEDLGYQVEVLRAKLHEARRALATRPHSYDTADLGYQAEQMLRNAQLQADQMRSDAERELREVRAQTQRILQEHAEQQARLQAELHTEAVNRRQQLDQELAERRATVESHVNENVAWAEQLRARSESQAQRLLDE
ncbi:M protein, partial [Streptomyces sp. NRRL WC-3753]